ncbi:MAG: hypothetical protein ACE5HV_09865 [Acidobacteriota bacterium]
METLFTLRPYSPSGRSVKPRSRRFLVSWPEGFIGALDDGHQVEVV